MKRENKRIILALFILVLFIWFASKTLASEYDFTLQKELNINVMTGEIELGRLIFTPRITNLSTYYLNENQSTINLQVSDTLCNNRSEAINIINTSLLLTGQCNNQLTTGLYSAVGVTSNQTISVGVSPPTNKLVFLTAKYSPFPITFSKNNFSTNVSSEVFISLLLPFELLPGAYRIPFSINSNPHEHTINVIGFTNWNVDFEQTQSVVSVGSTGSLGIIRINNTGNSFTKINIEDNDDNGMLNHPNKILSYSNVPVEFEITYNIPADYELTNNSFMLTFTDDDGESTQVGIVFSTVDDSPPVFDGFTQSSVTQALRPFWYNITTLDNSAVKTVTLTINNTIFHPIITGDTYSFNITLNSVGDYNGVILAVDESGNIASKDVSFNINMLNSLDTDNAVSMPKTKYNIWSDKIIITSNHPTPLTLKLIDLTYNGTWSIKIVSGEESYIINSVNETVSFETVRDNLTLSFQGSVLGLYNGIINLSTIIEHIAILPISFNGEHINYTTYDSFVEENYYGAYLQVDYSDPDDYTNAFTELYMKIPGWHSKEDINTPTTKSIRDELDRAHKSELSSKNDRLRNRALLITTLFIILGFVLTKNFYDNYIADKIMFIKSHK